MKIFFLYLFLMTFLIDCHLFAVNSNVGKYLSKDGVSKTFYGFMYYDWDYGTKGFVSFDISSTYSLDLFSEVSRDICAGAFAEDSYYAYFTEYDDDYGMYVPSSLSKVDMTNGNVTQIVVMDRDRPLLRDMTYDYSTGTMFGIKTESGLSVLVKLNLTNGNISDVVQLEQNYITLACNYSGSLFGVTSSGNFYSIDKNTGATEFIGETEQEPYAKQSMEFDHDNNTLYWLCNNSDNESFLAKVDVNSGFMTKVGSLGDHAQLTGLYIPFDRINGGAPAKVNNFAVTPGTNGVLNAALSWTNPTVSYSGGALSEITKVEIYRNNELIHTVTETNVGASVNWTDNVSVNGSYTYKVVAVNSIGSGPSSLSSVFLGRDLADGVTSLVLTVDGSVGKLSWVAPTKGLQNGWFDNASLRYKIVRMPDNVVVSENATGNSFEDNTIVSLNKYSYSVISITSDGEGGKTVSNVESIGTSLTVPYFYDFESVSEFQLWTVVDANNDNYKWKLETKSLSDPNHVAQFYANRNIDSDDWMITPPIYFEKGKNYELKFKVSSFGQNNPESMKITLGQGNAVVNQTIELADYPKIINKEFELKTIRINVEETGIYNIGFYCYSLKGGLFLYVDDVTIEQHGDDDLAAIGLIGNNFPIKNKSYDYTVTVKNVGEVEQNNFIVKLIDGNNNVLASTEINDLLNVGESKDYIVNWTPAETGIFSVRGYVELTLDINSGNNSTNVMSVEVRPEDSDVDLIQVGFDKKESNMFPFNFTFKTGVSQFIYLQEEIGLNSGLVKKIIYPYSFDKDDIVNKPVKIYMANTFENSLKEDFIAKNELILVYDGNITMPKNQKQLVIELDTPFLYSGQNIVVMCENVMGEGGFVPGVFYLSSTGSVAPFRSRAYNNDVKAFDFQPKIGRVFDVIPNIIFGIDVESGGSISGTMVDDYEDAVAGVLVKIDELKAMAVADNNGAYHFKNIPEGSYTLSMVKTGYYDFQWPNVQIKNNEVTSLYLELERMSKCTVNGKVLNPEGEPLEGAEVKISGYADFNVITDVNGDFIIEKVFVNSNYTISATYGDLAEYTGVFSTMDDDLKMDVIRMIDKIYPVCNISNVVSENGMKIDWDITNSVKKFRRDDGSVNSELNAGANNPYQIFGTVYREHTVLYSMSWQTTDNSCKHDKVNVFVFALDVNGNPTTEILYSKNDVPNEDWKWCSYKFDVPVEAPYGFLVALTSNLPMDIAVDSGDDEQYPFVDNTNFSGNYKLGVFAPLETLGFFENFHIRAEGAVKVDNNSAVDALRVKKGFNIWRLKAGQEFSSDVWVKLNQEPITDLNFTDLQWSELEAGLYRYAICSVYSGDNSSVINMSKVIANKMSSVVKVNVKTNTSSNVAIGAIVSLTNNDGDASHKYSAETDVNGNVTFGDVWKGNYILNVVHPDFVAYQSDNNDFSTEREYDVDVVLNEKFYDPFNLKIEETDVEYQRVFSWNESESIFDNFEDHRDFGINSAGSVGWQYIDGDQENPITISGINFASNGKKAAYTIFNPFATVPALNEDKNVKPFSGSKFLGCFTNRYVANDDYLISPELFFDEDFVLSFMAKSYSDSYMLSQIQIGYSYTGKDKEDFIWITESAVDVEGTKWNKLVYDIPARASYVAIKCVSVNSFLLMIDDVFIGKNESRNVSVFEVYLDGIKVGETSSKAYTFDGLSVGLHNAGVKAKYETGSSELMTIDFNVSTVGVDENINNAVKIYPNPVIGSQFSVSFSGVVSGDVTLFNEAGLLVKNIDVSNFISGSDLKIDVKDLSDGIYFLKMEINNVVSTFKIVVVK